MHQALLHSCACLKRAFPAGEVQPVGENSVFTAAGGVLQDAPIAKLTPESVRAVFAPKVDGAVHLLQSCWATPLAALTAFSSVASFIGSAGQGNYAAANSALDAWAASVQVAGVSGPCSSLMIALLLSLEPSKLLSQQCLIDLRTIQEILPWMFGT